jgi:hypothetical protein
MSLIGAVSLTNKEGLFLGSVNLDNLNLDPNQLLYSSNGVDMEGLNLGNGLDLSGSDLQTVGNPNIQILSNSIYCNDNVGATPIQTAVNSADGDTIYISSGSYGESQITIDSKINIALAGPPTGQYSSTLCEVLGGFSLKGTSDQIRFSNLQIKGTTELKGVGRYKFSGCVFTGTAVNNISINISQATKFMTFFNCEFDQFCSISVANTFGSVIYFINCGFNGATITLNNVSPLQVIFNNCSGLTAFNTAKSTLVGLNTTVSGTIQNNLTELQTTNGNIKTTGNLNFETGAFISINNVSSSDKVNQAIVADGANGLKFAPFATSSLYYVDGYSGQYGGTSTGSPLTIFQKVSQANITPLLSSIISFSLNLSVSGGADTLTLILKDDTSLSTLSTLVYSVPNGNQTITGNFFFNMPNNYATISYSIVGTLASHNITVDANMAYNILFYQIFQ